MEGVMKCHEDLDVWQKAVDLSVRVYELTKAFPSEEKFGLTSQMRRAAVSIPSNIAEGAARQGPKEFIQFLSIASGSVSELDTQVVICRKLGLGLDEQWHVMRSLIKDISKMIQGLIRSINAREGR
jgi:four helix bundle protein